MRQLPERFRKCDQCGKDTDPPAAGVWNKSKDLWLCLVCGRKDIHNQETLNENFMLGL